MARPPTDEEWSWVSADGHLRSGSRDDLMRWYAEGNLPAQNPVKKNDWKDWISAGELVAPPTEPYNAAPAFEDTLSTRKQRTLVMPSDSMQDDVTVPIAPLSSQQAQEVLEIIPVTAPLPPPFRRPSPQQTTLPLEQAPPPPVPLFQPSLPQVPSFQPPLFQPSLPVPAPSLPPPRSHSWLLWIAGGLFLVALVTVALAFVFLFRNRPTATTSPKPSAAPVTSTLAPAPAPAPREPQPTACKASGERVRWLAIVPPGATPNVATRNDRLVFGIPTSERGGVGVTIEPKTLAIVETVPFADATRVAGVVPSGAGFSVDRFATRVPGSDFSLGMTPNGLSRLGDDATQAVVWEGEANLPITRPVFTRVAGRGYAVAFRRGDADVRAGWIDERGEKKSDLVRLTSEAVKSSAPSIAHSGERVVVTFSAVDAQGTSRIVLADLSPKLRTLPTTGQNPRAPAIEALAKDRFVVSWLEGDAAGGRSLHTRVVNADLEPLGADESIATFTRPVESVALWQHAEHAIVLLSERAAESRNELFAQRLECR